jgi:hypothetical protein
MSGGEAEGSPCELGFCVCEGVIVKDSVLCEGDKSIVCDLRVGHVDGQVENRRHFCARDEEQQVSLVARTFACVHA